MNTAANTRQGEETKDEQILHCGLYDSVQVGFFDSGTREFRQVLWYCEDDAPPSRKNTGKSLDHPRFDRARHMGQAG